jgi:hypothetical protein
MATACQGKCEDRRVGGLQLRQHGAVERLRASEVSLYGFIILLTGALPSVPTKTIHNSAQSDRRLIAPPSILCRASIVPEG